jgi:hypothetical protein
MTVDSRFDPSAARGPAVDTRTPTLKSRKGRIPTVLSTGVPFENPPRSKPSGTHWDHPLLQGTPLGQDLDSESVGGLQGERAKALR